MGGRSGEPTGDGEKPSEASEESAAETGEQPEARPGEQPDAHPSAEPGRVALVLGRIRVSWSSGWWLPVGFGAVLGLVVLAAFPPWPSGVAEGLSGGPLWVAVPALAVAVSLVVGVGSRRSAWWATGAAGVAVVAGLYAFLRPDNSPLTSVLDALLRDRDSSDASGGGALAESLAQSPARPVAPLAVVFACVVAGLLCVALARRRRSWPRLDGRVQARRLGVLVMVGALLGGLLNAAAGFGAGKAQQALEGDAQPAIDVVSDPVPEEDRAALSRQVRYALLGYDVRDIEPSKVSWERTLSGPGPVGLAECQLDKPSEDDLRWGRSKLEVAAQSTLVSVKNGRKSDAVVGHNPRDGREIWRYTVNHAKPTNKAQRIGLRNGESRLGQVAVLPDCRVLAIVDPFTLVVLEASTGEVVETTTLPVTPQLREENPEGWRFVTTNLPAKDEAQEPDKRETAAYAREPLVQLTSVSRVFLESDGSIVEVNGASGKPVAYSLTLEDNCEMLADKPGWPQTSEHRPMHVLIQGCSDAAAFTVDNPVSEIGLNPSRQAAQDEDLEGLYPQLPHPSQQVPLLGCAASPRIYDLRSKGKAENKSVLVFGEWCKDRERDQDEKLYGGGSGDGPLVVELRLGEKTYDERLKPYSVFQLPKDTTLPLRPKSTRSNTSWLSDGELHVFSNYVTRLEVPSRSKALAAEGPFEAFLPPVPGHERQRAYAVTTSGKVLNLDIPDTKDVGRNDRLELAAAFDGAKGKCTGTRDLLLDEINDQLLMTCSTDAGTKVTALTNAKK